MVEKRTERKEEVTYDLLLSFRQEIYSKYSPAYSQQQHDFYHQPQINCHLIQAAYNHRSNIFKGLYRYFLERQAIQDFFQLIRNNNIISIINGKHNR